MSERDPKPLDYYTPDPTGARAETEEQQRRRKVREYNEAEFGESRPFAGTLVRLTLMSAIAGIVLLLLPHWLHGPFACIAWVTFVLVERGRNS